MSIPVLASARIHKYPMTQAVDVADGDMGRLALNNCDDDRTSSVASSSSSRPGGSSKKNKKKTHNEKAEKPGKTEKSEKTKLEEAMRGTKSKTETPRRPENNNPNGDKITVKQTPNSSRIDPVTGEETHGYTISIPPSLMQFADLDLAACETASKLMLLRSIEENMPHDHPGRPYVQKVVDALAKSGLGASDLSGVRTSMCMRIGPDKKGIGASIEEIKRASEVSLNKLIGREGESIVTVDNIIEETPGDPQTNIEVHYSCPMQFKGMMQGKVQGVVAR